MSIPMLCRGGCGEVASAARCRHYRQPRWRPASVHQPPRGTPFATDDSSKGCRQTRGVCLLAEPRSFPPARARKRGGKPLGVRPAARNRATKLGSEDTTRSYPTSARSIERGAAICPTTNLTCSRNSTINRGDPTGPCIGCAGRRDDRTLTCASRASPIQRSSRRLGHGTSPRRSRQPHLRADDRG